jgi:hypothetical protein
LSERPNTCTIQSIHKRDGPWQACSLLDLSAVVHKHVQV